MGGLGLHRKTIGLITGLIAFFYFLLFWDAPTKHISYMSAIAALMAIWWTTEALPLAITALLPLVLYPLFGILSTKQIAPTYMSSILFLFIGGFLIALAMEKWNLHKRIALYIIRIFNGSPTQIILGFMIATAFLSMWISNTATTVMMVPIGLAIILKLEETFNKKITYTFSVALMLSIAYSASIGGIATLVGTPPNMTFIRLYEISFPNNPEISFGQWMKIGIPVMLTMLGICWFLLTKIIFKSNSELILNKEVVENEYQKLSHVSYEEKVVMGVFTLTACLWIFRKNLQLGSIEIPGWSSLLPYPNHIDDGTVAIFMAIFLFILPAKTNETRLLDHTVFKRIPWDIILLFGGGFALAKGFQISGLSQFIGNKFSALEGVSLFLIIVLIAFGITFLTELTSNMSTTEMILPILASIATVIQVDPLYLMIPATLSASCAFMLPVATAPNAIVFGSERVHMKEMIKAGIWLNLIGICVISILCAFILPL